LLKDAKFLWSERQEEAFQTLKNYFTSEQVLRMPDPMKPLQIETNASQCAIAAILSIKINDLWYPSTFISRSLSTAK
jgi:hypothetical protein